MWCHVETALHWCDLQCLPLTMTHTVIRIFPHGLDAMWICIVLKCDNFVCLTTYSYRNGPGLITEDYFSTNVGGSSPLIWCNRLNKLQRIQQMSNLGNACWMILYITIYELEKTSGKSPQQFYCKCGLSGI